MDVTVAVGTYGDESWSWLAQTRAKPSALEQEVPVIHCHANSLAEARNQALREVNTEWVIHLDADDELEPGYVEAMLEGTADVRGPVARYMIDGRERNLWQPRVAGHRHTCGAACLRDGNWLIVGSMARVRILRRAGGWRDWDWSEDWDMWIRCWRAGATFELVKGAIYRAHVRQDSRNRSATQAAKLAAHRAIEAANFA